MALEWIYLPSSAVQESAHEPQFGKCPLNGGEFPAGLACKMRGLSRTECKLAFLYNHVGLLGLKAPALHSARGGKSLGSQHNQNWGEHAKFDNLARANPSFHMWRNCYRCRRRGRCEFIVYYLSLSWEICWGCIIQVILCSREDHLSSILLAILRLRHLWLCLTAIHRAYDTILPFYFSGLASSCLKLDSSCLSLLFVTTN